MSDVKNPALLWPVLPLFCRSVKKDVWFPRLPISKSALIVGEVFSVTGLGS